MRTLMVHTESFQLGYTNFGFSPLPQPNTGVMVLGIGPPKTSGLTTETYAFLFLSQN